MEDGVPHVQETDHPTEFIRRQSADGSELVGLTVTRPGLEDVYLRMVGATEESGR